MAKTPASQRLRQTSKPNTQEPAARFAFDQFCILSVQFKDLSDGGSIPVTKDSASEPERAGIALRMGIDEEAKRSELRMMLSLLPPPEQHPYQVSIEVLGRFSTKDGTVEQLKRFTQENAPVILFPFVRAAVFNATAEACQGPLRMNPLDLRGLIKPGGWSDEARPEQPTKGVRGTKGAAR
ncbi:MAG: protein-export chaperone SecB [Terriglobales bacterium]